jgi:hypothetical protein
MDQTSPHDSPGGNPPGSSGAFSLQGPVASGWAHMKPLRPDRPLASKARRLWIATSGWDKQVPEVEVSPRRGLLRGRVGLGLWMRPCEGGLDYWLLFGWATKGPPVPPDRQVRWLRATEAPPWDFLPLGDVDLSGSLQGGIPRYLAFQLTTAIRSRMDALIGQPLVDRLLLPRRVPWAVRVLAPQCYQFWVGL